MGRGVLLVKVTLGLETEALLNPVLGDHAYEKAGLLALPMVTGSLEHVCTLGPALEVAWAV